MMCSTLWEYLQESPLEHMPLVKSKQIWRLGSSAARSRSPVPAESTLPATSGRGIWKRGGPHSCGQAYEVIPENGENQNYQAREAVHDHAADRTWVAGLALVPLGQACQAQHSGRVVQRQNRRTLARHLPRAGHKCAMTLNKDIQLEKPNSGVIGAPVLERSFITVRRCRQYLDPAPCPQWTGRRTSPSPLIRPGAQNPSTMSCEAALAAGSPASAAGMPCRGSTTPTIAMHPPRPPGSVSAC